MTIQLRRFPYAEDTAALFAAVAERPWSVLLDSGHGGAQAGRYDILAAEPHTTLVTRGARTEIKLAAGGRRFTRRDPFRVLGEVLGPARAAPAGVPFAGGAIGYFGYELSGRIEGLPPARRRAGQLPEMAIGLYDWAVVVDHLRRSAALVGPRGAAVPAWVAQLGRPVPGAGTTEPRQAVHAGIDRSAYGEAFARIRRYIREGDCYQVNFAQRFELRGRIDPWPLYRRLRRENPAPFGAFLNYPFASVLSSSPERFLEVRGRRVETRPIKGTRPRGSHPAEDRALAQELLRSAKDRAENVMIVDLLRNDLGKDCVPGSVRVPALCALESFAGVHHLVSTVRGTLAPGRTALDLLRDCFPGGSITGAPKRRAMEIIAEIEPHARGVYCGAIGYVGYDGDMDTNIAIRTLVDAGGRSTFWAGGGIVADSDEEAEYRESLDKAAAFLRLLGPVWPRRAV